MSKSMHRTLTGFAVIILLLIFGWIAARLNPDWALLVFPTGRRAGLFLRTVVLCGGAAFLDLFLGMIIASAFLGRGRRMAFLRWVPLILAVLPPYIQALAWNDLFGGLPAHLPGELVAGWVMAMAYLPVGIGLALLGLETVVREPVEAARLWQDDAHVLWKVVLPLSRPLLAAGFVFLFLINLMDYSVPSLFGVNVFALEIFAEYSATNQPLRVLFLSLPLVLVAFALLPILQGGVRFAAQSQVRGASPWKVRPVWPQGVAFIQNAALAICALQVGIPIFSLVRLSASPSGTADLFLPAMRDLAFSFGIAIAAALLSLPLSWAFLEGMRRRRTLQWLVVIPLAIPAPLVGAGMVGIFNQPWLTGLYNSAWMPILAGLARFFPLAVLALAAQYQRVDPLLLDAARVFQKNRWRSALWVRLPLMAPGLIAAASLVFALTLGELGATLIVIPPGQNTLSLRIYNYLHYGASDVVARLCLLVLGLTLAAGVAAALSLAGIGRRRKTREREEQP